MTKMKNITKLSSLFVVVLFVLITAVSCSKEYDNHYDDKNEDIANTGIISVLEANGCAQFAAKLEQHNYDVFLSESRLLTVFAPKDAAFSALISGMTDEEVKMVLKFHIFDGSIPTSSISTDDELYSISGKKIIYDGTTFNGFNGDYGSIEKKNIRVKNGFVQVLEDVFVPAKSLGEVLEADYPKYNELFKAFSTEYDNVSAGRAIIDENGNSSYVVSNLIDYTFLNPYDESADYTLLPFVDSIYDQYFGELKSVLRGYSLIDEEMLALYEQFMAKHIYLDVVDSTTLADKFPLNYYGLPDQPASGRIQKADIFTSNGAIQQFDTILMPFENIQARVDFFYDTINAYIGNGSDMLLATSSRSNLTNLVKVDEAEGTDDQEGQYVIWSMDTTTTREDGYLFFSTSEEKPLAAAKYKVYMTHVIDSGYTDAVTVSISNTNLSVLLDYTSIDTISAGVPVEITQELGVISFDEYQPLGAEVRFDITEFRKPEGVTNDNDHILKIRKVSFVPFREDEL